MDRKSSISLQLAIPERERFLFKAPESSWNTSRVLLLLQMAGCVVPWGQLFDVLRVCVCVKFSQWLCCTICAFRTELPLSSSSSIILFFILFAQLRYSSPAPLSFADSLQELFVVGICHSIGEAHQLGTGLQASQPQGGNSKGLIDTRRHAGYPQNDI